jgi:SpoVK/Ycf46/Vps4 family AAA+-type ATPase
MMTRADIAVAAYTIAVNRGATTVAPIYVALAVVQMYDNLIRDRITIDQVLAYVPPATKTKTKPTFSDAAQFALDQCTNDDATIAWLQQTYQRLVAEESIDITAPPAPPAPPLPVAPARRSVAEVFADLDALIGLTPVKQAVREIVARQQAMAFLATRGTPAVFSKHLVFTGAPGTGKTTVARYVGELYAAINVLPTTSFIEVSRADLIGQFIGQTAPKVQDVVNRARGGVLFIDEAYALMPHHESDYGHEALSTLVQLMENYRDDLVVIMAGYRDEMRALINVNPGLRSRMTTYIDFPDYAPAELGQIFTNIIAHYGITLTSEALEYLTTQLGQVFTTGEYGNARYVRSLWEHAFTSMALREFADGNYPADALRQLTRADIAYAITKLAAMPAPLRSLTSS